MAGNWEYENDPDIFNELFDNINWFIYQFNRRSIWKVYDLLMC